MAALSFKSKYKFPVPYISFVISELGEKFVLSSNNSTSLKEPCHFSLERKNTITELGGFPTFVII